MRGRRSGLVSRRPSWGENPAVRVGELLQAFLQPATGPFAAFSFDFQFDLLQRGHPHSVRWVLAHGLESTAIPLVKAAFSSPTLTTVSRCARGRVEEAVGMGIDA